MFLNFELVFTFLIIWVAYTVDHLSQKDIVSQLFERIWRVGFCWCNYTVVLIFGVVDFEGFSLLVEKLTRVAQKVWAPQLF